VAAGKLSPVSVAEILLVLVGVPLAVIAVVALLIFVPGGRKHPRWKSGQPWDHEPIWYEPHAGALPAEGHGSGHGSNHGSGHVLEAGPTSTGGPLGGARGTW
jgi:hypothetical protein